MDEDRDYIELVRQARLGDRKSLDDLAGLVRGRLYAYVYRIMLEEDLAQDIVQESMLEMFKVLGKLERADRFWPWLRGIAFNKIRQHQTQQHRRRMVPMSNIKQQQGQKKDNQAGLAGLVSDELKQIVFDAMRELKPRYRKVLAMRCYEEMQYSEIAELMGCSELGMRVLFYRAKRALQKALSRKGFEKGFLLTALVVFGKMTAPSEALAAQVSVTAASTKVGVGAALLAMAASKTAIVSLATIGALALVTTVVRPGDESQMAMPGERSAENSGLAGYINKEKGLIGECWYYYPAGVDGPVMIRMMKSESHRKQSYCAWRQNEQANYYFNKHKNTIYINNWRMWRQDLAVCRLPTDTSELRDFISRVEGRREQMEYVPASGDGLLVIASRDVNGNYSRIVHHHHVLDEEYFRCDWPTGIKMVDRRDSMHKRGWTYFTVDGRIRGERISGVGRIPFVYAASKQYYPWIRLQVGERIRIVDSGEEALVYDGSGGVLASYLGGSFFKGLSRPWIGLHTIDTVRRDAAEQQVWFETKYKLKEEKAEVVLTCGQGKLIYTIDMEKDVIDKIAISTSDGREGELKFSYVQDIDLTGDEFVEPQISRYYGNKRQASHGILWLTKLIIDN